MSAANREQIEREVRDCCDRGDRDAAATAAVRGYGPELFGFLMALHRDEAEASDVFSIVTENLWRALPKFGWECSLRTWAYTIARNASSRYRKGEHRRARGAVPASEHASAMAMAARTATRSFVKTEHKNRLTRLRESLPPEDQMLLVLRVDRGLAWNDLARVMGEEMDQADEETLKREAARLRKRFQVVKDKLVALGRREGLVPDRD